VRCGREGCWQAGDCPGRQEQRQESVSASRGLWGAGNGECASGGMEVQAGEYTCVPE
jgi:hypothetical protein